jgi:enoyl-CoA hydratase/carnithine racemase
MSAREATEKDNRSLLEFHISDHIATICLNDPSSRNALSREMMSQLQEKFDGIATNADIHVVIIEATGPVFCSGHNLKEVIGIDRDEIMRALFQQCSTMMQSIVHLPQPVIAKINGVATAAGTQLVASCDLAFATTTSKFATPGVNLGLFCSTPMVALSRNVSPKHAMEMLLSGDFIDADQAERTGLINQAVPEAELEARVLEFARKIASKSPLTVRTGKTAFYQQLPLPLKEAYDFTSRVMSDNMQTRDAREGITAFLEKRDPEWRGE